MIIIGYQGIGKSTVSKNGNGFIDLESGNFWIDGKRDDKWYIIYCNIANHLSSQGYYVFVSSHEVVRKELKNSDQRVIVVCPSLKLKDVWIDRLKLRYEQTKTDKDYKALMNAIDRYTENIQELLDAGFDIGLIEKRDLSYDLIDLVKFAGDSRT